MSTTTYAQADAAPGNVLVPPVLSGMYCAELATHQRRLSLTAHERINARRAYAMTSPALRKIACIGEVMLELVEDENGDPVLGVAGDSYNTAVYLARSLKDADVSTAYVTALGTDPYSDKIMSAMRDHGLNTEFVERRATHLPGIYAVHTNDVGERSFSYWRSQSAARTLFEPPCDVTLDSLKSFDLVYLSGISVAILPAETRQALLTWIDGYRAQGGKLAYDSNYRPRLWDDRETAQSVTQAMWSRTDIALPSVDDEMELYGDASEKDVIARLKAFGVTMGALKRGAAGPLDLAGEVEMRAAPSVVNVVDTTAAGDSFNAGFLAALARGQGAAAALDAGHTLASVVIQHRGAIIPDPG